MTNALAAYGTLMQIGDGATPEVYATIAEVLDISTNVRLNTEDATNHSSPNAWGEKIATIKEMDDITFQVNYIPDDTTHGYSAGLMNDLDDRTLRNFKIVFTDSATTEWIIPAYVAAIGPAMPVRGKLTASIVLSVASAPTLA